jgi:benzoyl-CoA reductase/2-hydroxyglutaryl-CoA dehydratase subunit BcrC/BadD/HgdB
MFVNKSSKKYFKKKIGARKQKDLNRIKQINVFLKEENIIAILMTLYRSCKFLSIFDSSFKETKNLPILHTWRRFSS